MSRNSRSPASCAAFAFAFLLVAGVPGATAADELQTDATPNCTQPPDLHDGWPVGTPEQYGFDPAVLCPVGRRAAQSNVHAIIVARHGVLVYERYFSAQDQRVGEPPTSASFDATTKQDLHSATKSVVSLVFGIALARGWVTDLDVPVASYFADDADVITPAKRRILVRHLLTMSDGLDWHEFSPPFDSFGEMANAADPYRYVLGRDLLLPPGRSYNYNSGDTELLGEILHRTSGRPLDTLVKEELLGPLGIEDVDWLRLPNGNPMANSGLLLRPRDTAKVGQLVLDHGVWGQRQLVPESWIAQSITPQNNGPDGYLYGYQWWLGRSFIKGREINWAGAFGWGGQRLIVVPDKDLVVFVTAYLPRGMDLPESVLLNQYILPAIVSD
jgi:CubicO group peptidase (beta-lactamase class C family)